MIDRYTLPEMGELWTEENRFRVWLRVEVAACEAQAELGIVHAGTTSNLSRFVNPSFNFIEISGKKIEVTLNEFDHDKDKFKEKSMAKYKRLKNKLELDYTRDMLLEYFL